MSNLVNSSGVIAADVTGVGTARNGVAAATYGGDKAIFGFGLAGSVTGVTNLVNNSGVVGSDVAGVGTARRRLGAANYGGDKVIFAFGNSGSVTNVKNIINKNGGKMGESGTVGWKFDRKGVILIKLGDKDPEEAELEIIDAGADDLSLKENVFEVLTQTTDLMKVKDNLEKAGFEIIKAELSYLAKDTVNIDSSDKAKKVLNFIDLLEDDEDVNNVFSDFDIPEEVLENIT